MGTEYRYVFANLPFLKNISYLAKTIWPLQNTDGTGSKASLKFLRKLTSCALRLTSLLMLQDQEISVSFSFFTTATPTRTHFINGLNSYLLKLPFLA